MTFTIKNNMVVADGRIVYARNLRNENGEYRATGVFQLDIDENGNEYRTAPEMILTEDGDTVVIE